MLITKVNGLPLMVIGCSLVFGVPPEALAHTENTITTGKTIPTRVDTDQQGAVPLTAEQSRAQILASLPVAYSPVYLKTLSVLYAQNNMKPMWQSEEAIQAFSQQLAEVAIAGIQPQFADWAEMLTHSTLQGISRDLVLSDAMLGYLDYISAMKNEGNSALYGGRVYKLKTPSQESINQWQMAIKQDNIFDFINALAPSHPQYSVLRQVLHALIQPAAVWPKLQDTATLRPGSMSQDVPVLREILMRSINVSTDHHVSGDSHHYSPELVESVKRFQRQQGLEPDGIIGAQTRYWLNMTPEKRAAIVALNMQRLRLLPDKVETAIMVNIPDYSLVYYLNGHQALQSRVIVGRPDRKTPLMSSVLNNVVINPPWNVPQSLARKDILPKVRQDPGYLERLGYSIYEGWSHGAESIDPWLVDWSTITERNLPFRFQQKPGQHNALGRYKFNMPNSESIYLHDTPNHSLFSREARALSSGCVRVNKASELAGMLLHDVGWNTSRISNTLDKGNTTFVSIGQNVPVMLYYLTAFSGDDGHITYRNDIYHYDRQAQVGADNVNRARPLVL